ncbi:MAG: Hsp20/alpha crystallin family protein, partial [Anaerolineales bacterium]|nr:Hsp20/alpha crystallin family protein [Anaerolineales bacterium]
RMNLFNEFDRMVNDMIEWSAPTVPARWGLPLDVAETENEYTVMASIPGLNPDDIEVTLEENVLTISGESREETVDEGTRYHLRERRFGSFSRSLRFPVPVAGESIAANYTNGVLTLTVPKAEEVKPKRIAIKAA